MNCVILGANKSGLWLKDVLDKKFNNEFNIKYFCDNNKSLQGQICDGLEVIDVNKLSLYFKSGDIDAVIIAVGNVHHKSISKQLYENKIYNVYIVPYYMYKKNIDEISIDQLLYKIDVTKPRLNYMEYHVSNYCNLNCKGCSHFCNLISKPSFGNLKNYVSDLNRLKELAWGIEKIRLMGGEPLLNPDLDKFIISSRGTFPDSSLRVVTNGLLIPSSNPHLFEVMKKYDCKFDISLYKPTKKILNKITDICQQYGIEYDIMSVESFRKWHTLSPKNDPCSSYENCISKHCSYLQNGQISTCGFPQHVKLFNKYFNQNIQINDCDLINIYNSALTGWELDKKLSSPMECCKYCTTIKDSVSYEWSLPDKDLSISDWFII